jgi:RHS repeat-associated protein
LRKYIYGSGIDEPIIMIDASGNFYYYHYDALGSVVALSKVNGSISEIVEAYVYDVFGKCTVVTSAGTDGSWMTPADGTTAAKSQKGNPYLFTGRRYDDELELKSLYYYRARIYSADLGRFLQPDPVGYIDSVNLYTYCGNNPVNFIDPYGLCKTGGWVDWLHGALDVVGTFDPTPFSDGLNAGIYAFQGQWGYAGISAAAMLPYFGDVGKVAKYGEKGLKYLDEAASVGKNALKNSDDVAALIDLAQRANKTGVSVEDAKTLLKWADEYNVKPALNHTKPPFHGTVGPHVRIGPVKHIPVKR